MQKVVIVLLELTFLLLLSSCATTSTFLQFRSPSGSPAIELEVPRLTNDGRMNVCIVDSGRVHVLYSTSSEILLYFADVSWSSSYASVVTCGNPALRVGISMKDYSFVPFQVVEAQARDSIHKNYPESKASVDVFEWACSNDGGISAFRQRYPWSQP